MNNPNYDYITEKVPSDRWVLLQGSTRSGKTWSLLHWIISFCYKHSNNGIEIDITRKTFKQLKSTIWKDFEDITKMLGIYKEENHHRTEHRYELFGNYINYYGVDDGAKVHGRKRDILIMNEANQFPEDVVDQLTPRTRFKIIADFNPALGREHWLDQYIDKYGVLITTYKDNPHLTPDQVADIESKRGNKYWWSIYGEGKRANVEGACFDNWKEGEFKIDGQPIIDSWFGLDFGYSSDPTALVECFITKDTIYAKECFYETQLNTKQIAKLCQEFCKGKLIIADSAEPRLIAELRKEHGLNIQGAKKVTINEGIVLMNDYNIVASGSNLKKELSMYKWADKGKTIPIDDYNHLLDSLRYACMFKLMRKNYGKYVLG